MNNKSNHTDDFKKLFDSESFAQLPLDMEERVMNGIEFEKLKAKRFSPMWFSKNLVIFSLSITLLTLLSVFQFVTDFQFPMLQDIQLLLLGSTGIFLILWLTELVEASLLVKFNSELQSN